MGIKPSGRVDEPLQPWLVELDVDTGRTLRTRTWTTPHAHSAGPTVHQEFTAAHLATDGSVWQPTHTEVLRLDPRDMSVQQVVSHPLFHGLHSTSQRPGGGFVAAAAGIDSVLEVDDSGALTEHHFLRSQPFADAYPGIADFRRVPYDGLKPHSHHPNHATYAAGTLWATCFETQSAIAVHGKPHAPISLAPGIPHDGRLYDGALWFTWIDGVVLAIDPSGHEQLRIDLSELDPTPGLLGWCRGLAKVGDRLFVGMTMLRRPRHREVIRRLVQGPAGEKRPTRVVEIDLRERRMVRQFPLGNAAGGTIYGLTLIDIPRRHG
jgi:hypothetical protein